MPIFELSQPGRIAAAHIPADSATPAEHFRGGTPAGLPKGFEFQTLRRCANLSRGPAQAAA